MSAAVLMVGLASPSGASSGHQGPIAAVESGSGAVQVPDPVGAASEPLSDRWIVVIAERSEEQVVTALLGDTVAASADSDQRRIQDGVWVFDPATALRAAEMPGVLEARPEQRFHAAVEPNDTCYTTCPGHAGQWHHTATKAPAAWDVATGDGSVMVAVLDSGIRDTHVDLTGRVSRTNGCGLHVALPGSKDHGTHVAGVIGAATDNAVGVAGVAWSVQILDVRVLQGEDGFESDIVTGVQCAADLGADVINLSLEAKSLVPSTPLASAIAYAQARGAVVVAAAGNAGGNAVRYPAGYDQVIGVISTDQTNTVSSFSDRGPWADIAAPGDNIVSLSGSTNFGVTTLSGTSFAAPIVSGAVALVEAEFPTFTNEQIARRLLWTSAGYSTQGSSSEYGLLDLSRALSAPRRHVWQVTDLGEVIALGDAPHLGDASALAVRSGSAQGAALSRPIVAMASTPSGDGYWLAAADGGIFAFGDAVFLGSTGGLTLNQPIVAMASTPSGDGYWLAAADGGIFAFGGAPFLGSTGAITLNQPIGTLITTAEGYGLVAADGGMFNYGPTYLGSGANIPHSGTVVGAAAYVEVAP